MPENEETQGTQETQNTQGTLETLEAIKAQLEEEKKAKAAADQALNDLSARLAEKDRALSAMSTRQAELEASLNEAQQAAESLRAEGVAISEANSQAVAKYLGAVRAANPTIPQDIIAGDTIEEIDASVEKALSIASAVKASLEAQAKEAKVPAGAPTRGEISLEGLTPREKIAAGIQKGSQI
jgi:septal ring factor EnvC (AmiA/AmiB activator)